MVVPTLMKIHDEWACAAVVSHVQIHVSLEDLPGLRGQLAAATMLKIDGPLIFPPSRRAVSFSSHFYELSMTTLLYSNTTKTIRLSAV